MLPWSFLFLLFSLSFSNASGDDLTHFGFGHSEHDLKVRMHFVPSGHEGHVIGTSSHGIHVSEGFLGVFSPNRVIEY